ncbi:hypothetical protein SNK04_014081 [Fusarium graminearum]
MPRRVPDYLRERKAPAGLLSAIGGPSPPADGIQQHRDADDEEGPSSNGPSTRSDHRRTFGTLARHAPGNPHHRTAAAPSWRELAPYRRWYRSDSSRTF